VLAAKATAQTRLDACHFYWTKGRATKNKGLANLGCCRRNIWPDLSGAHKWLKNGSYVPSASPEFESDQ
jgi:hypothetical protein